MGRIALGIEYDGAAVYGWQRQREVPSVQEHLEKALSTVANEPIEVQCAGRTDAGVHATGQVVHFNCDAPRSERAWTLGVNANLPNSVAVTWAKNVADDFHVTFFSYPSPLSLCYPQRQNAPRHTQFGRYPHSSRISEKKNAPCCSSTIG